MAGKKLANGQGASSAQADRPGARAESVDPQTEHGGEAGERERAADERERLADERERLADERDRAADARERAADVREASQDGRQHDADERERGLDQHWRALGVTGPELEQRMMETIERARELLELSRKRLDRQEARVRRDVAGHDRQQAEVDRASAEGSRREAVMQDSLAPVEWARVLRKQSLAAITVFATSEEEAAGILDQLAATVSPELRDQIRLAASHARTAARSAREIVHKLGGSGHDQSSAPDRGAGETREQTGQESRSAQ